jgi:hypothetical protein
LTFCAPPETQAGNPTAHGKSKSLTVGSGESGSLDLKYPTAILLIDQEEL